MGDSDKPLNNTPDMQDAIRSIEAIREDDWGQAPSEPPTALDGADRPTPTDTGVVLDPDVIDDVDAADAADASGVSNPKSDQ